jgi:hypothetical protein
MFPIITEVMDNPEAAKIKALAGAHIIGGGCCASVWETERGTVLRVGSLKGNLGYLHFITELAKEHHNPHMPKIYSTQILEPSGHCADGCEGYLIVEMELLTEWHHTSYAKYKELYHKISRSLEHNNAPAKATKDLRKALHTIKKAKRRSGHSIDLAPFNTMVRGDGTLVITDPIWA